MFDIILARLDEHKDLLEKQLMTTTNTLASTVASNAALTAVVADAITYLNGVPAMLQNVSGDAAALEQMNNENTANIAALQAALDAARAASPAAAPVEAQPVDAAGNPILPPAESTDTSADATGVVGAKASKTP